MQWRALTIKAAMTRQVFRDEPSSLSIVRIWHSRQPLRGIIYVQKLNYLAAVVTLKRLVPKIRFGHLSIAYQAARVHRRGIAPDGFPRSSKLSEVAPQHGVKGRQMIVLGELSANTLRTVAPTKLRASALVFFAECARLIRYKRQDGRRT
jgi:hypothetical protein